MKRFLLFSGDTYYPCGGWADFVGGFENIVAAEAALPKGTGWSANFYDWWHIVDLETGKIVAGSELTDPTECIAIINGRECADRGIREPIILALLLAGLLAYAIDWAH